MHSISSAEKNIFFTLGEIQLSGSTSCDSKNLILAPQSLFQSPSRTCTAHTPRVGFLCLREVARDGAQRGNPGEQHR